MDISIVVPTRPYDVRQFGTPWIARTDFDILSKPDFHYGAWSGIRGKKGTLTLNEIKIGDIVAIGIEGSVEINWYVLAGPNRKLRRLDTKYMAYIQYLMRPSAIAALNNSHGVGGLYPNSTRGK